MRASTKGTLDIIHTKRLKLLKLSNEASCLTPTKLLKVKRIQVEGERLLCCGVCEEGTLPLLLYMCRVGFGEMKMVTNMNRP